MDEKIKGYSSWLDQHPKLKQTLINTAILFGGALYGVLVVIIISIGGYWTVILLTYIFTGQYWSALGIVGAIAAFLGAIGSYIASRDS